MLHAATRCKQTQWELEALRRELASWLSSARAPEARLSMYQSQLGALESFMESAVDALAGMLGATDVNGEVGAVFATCRELDLKVLALRRIWEFYREKYDQRLPGSPWAGVLAAADEVVWSCHAPVVTSAAKVAANARAIPTPLPFIEARYAQAAFPTTTVPDELATSGLGAFTAEFLRRLPIPVLRIPPTSAQVPWELVYIAHEIGHVAQHDLVADQALVLGFRKRVRDLAGARSVAAAKKWQTWSEEIFADAVSIHLLGPWALWAMVELVLDTPAAMSQGGNVRYPPAIIRLALMAAITDRLAAAGGGWKSADYLRGVEPERAVAAAGSAELSEHLAIACMVAELATGALAGLTGKTPGSGVTLADFFGVATGMDSVARWRKELLGPGEPAPPVQPRQSDARAVACATASAWSQLARAGSTASISHEELGRRALALMAACKAPGVRAALVTEDARALGRELAARPMASASSQPLAPVSPEPGNMEADGP